MKKLLVILSMFMFIPVLSAETYYDYEKVEVEELPEASSDTTNKVYIVGKSYFVVKEIVGEITPLPLNENLNGKTMYIKFPTNMNDILSKCSWICSFVSGSSTWYIDNRMGYKLDEPGGNNLLGNNYGLYYFNKNSSEILRNVDKFTFNFDFSIDSWVDESYSTFFSLSPFENTYEWLEVDKSQVIEITMSDDDFYFFFTFEDISSFNILQNYDLINLTDFQKIVLVLGFNIFFLGFLGLVIYILIKLLNKGISLLFR